MLYDQIIVPSDGTDPARSASLIGADLSKMLSVPLLLLTSAPTNSPDAIAGLKERAISMSDENIQVWVEAASRPERALATVASYRPNTLVVMPSHSRKGVGRLLFGDITSHVLRTVDTPVLVLGPACELRDPVDVRQMILCVDGTPHAESALTLAASWCQALHLRCLLLHVVTKNNSLTVDFDRLTATLREVCDEVEPREVEGRDAADGIIEVAQRSMASILVMATHGRRGLDRFRHPSVVADVVGRSPVPVLVQHGNVHHGVDALRESVAGTEAEPPSDPSGNQPDSPPGNPSGD